MNSFLSATSRPRSKPSDEAFLVRSGIVSSNEMKTPGSPYCTAPRTRNSSPNIVFPAPAPPLISVGRPAGKPPPVISSRPWMPVRDFRSVLMETGRAFFLGGVIRLDLVQNALLRRRGDCVGQQGSRACLCGEVAFDWKNEPIALVSK